MEKARGWNRGGLRAGLNAAHVSCQNEAGGGQVAAANKCSSSEAGRPLVLGCAGVHAHPLLLGGLVGSSSWGGSSSRCCRQGDVNTPRSWARLGSGPDFPEVSQLFWALRGAQQGQQCLQGCCWARRGRQGCRGRGGELSGWAR